MFNGLRLSWSLFLMKWPKRLCQKIIRVPDTTVITTICLYELFPSVCDTSLTSYTVSILIDVAFCILDKFNVLGNFFRNSLFMFVCQICDGRKHCGMEMVNWLWWLGKLDFLQGSQYTYNLWLSHYSNDNNISLDLLC